MNDLWVVPKVTMLSMSVGTSFFMRWLIRFRSVLALKEQTFASLEGSYSLLFSKPFEPPSRCKDPNERCPEKNGSFTMVPHADGGAQIP